MGPAGSAAGSTFTLQHDSDADDPDGTPVAEYTEHLEPDALARMRGVFLAHAAAGEVQDAYTLGILHPRGRGLR